MPVESSLILVLDNPLAGSCSMKPSASVVINPQTVLQKSLLV